VGKAMFQPGMNFGAAWGSGAPGSSPAMAFASQKRKGGANEPTHFWKEMATPEGVPYYYNAQTGETTWDKPEELKTQNDRDKEGDWIWMPHPTEAFVPAKRMGNKGNTIECVTEEHETHFVSQKEHPNLEKLYWSQLSFLQQDLVMLDVMSQPLILYNLKHRFLKNEIYTNVGTILISINPYKRLPLYTPNVIDQYMKRGSKKLPPHVFMIADDAFNYLREYKMSQSIVISGESGAGKTECTKQCLQYLAEVAGSSSNVEQLIHVQPDSGSIWQCQDCAQQQLESLRQVHGDLL